MCISAMCSNKRSFKCILLQVLLVLSLIFTYHFNLNLKYENCPKCAEKLIFQRIDLEDISFIGPIRVGKESSKFGYILTGEPYRNVPIGYTNNNDTVVKIKRQFSCRNWAVVTTIYNPTDSVRLIASNRNWCVAIVADINSQSKDVYLSALGYNSKRIIILETKDQDIFSPDLSMSIPWHHYGRKNIGYIFAIQNGAELIWDFDDDHEGIIDTSIIQMHTTMHVLKRCRGSNRLFNPYPYFGVNETYIWPRGYPLEGIRDTSTTPTLCIGNVSLGSVGVIQSLTNFEPDVDAIFRLTRDHPLNFEAKGTFPSIVVPQDSYCPFNAYATLWTKQAFPYMPLPISVQSRVSDIWRSYIAQLFFHRNDINLIFSPSFVIHKRTLNNTLGNLNAEIDLYQKSNIMVSFLKEFERNPNITMQTLYEELYRRGFVELEDLYFINLWIKAFNEVSASQ